MMISFWASEADRDAPRKSGFLSEQIAKWMSVVAGQPSVEHFEVSDEVST